MKPEKYTVHEEPREMSEGGVRENCTDCGRPTNMWLSDRHTPLCQRCCDRRNEMDADALRQMAEELVKTSAGTMSAFVVPTPVAHSARDLIRAHVDLMAQVANFTEWQLATLEHLKSKKSTPKSELDRQAKIVQSMVSVCRTFCIRPSTHNIRLAELLR